MSALALLLARPVLGLVAEDEAKGAEMMDDGPSVALFITTVAAVSLLAIASSVARPPNRRKRRPVRASAARASSMKVVHISSGRRGGKGTTSNCRGWKRKRTTPASA